MSQAPLIDPAGVKVLQLEDESRFVANGIASRTLLETDRGRVVLMCFDAGQQLSEHTSTHRAVIQILSGTCDFSLGGEPHALKAGDLVHMPPHLPHAVIATERFSMLLTLFKQ